MAPMCIFFYSHAYNRINIEGKCLDVMDHLQLWEFENEVVPVDTEFLHFVF